MPVVKKILHFHNKGDHANVYVQLDDGAEAIIYVGGAVEVFYHKGVTKAHVRRAQSRHIQIPIDKAAKKE